MSELGEYYQEQKGKLICKKAKALEWNTFVVMGLSVEYDFKVVIHTEFHLSLFHPERGRMDYYPSTSRAGWFNKNNKVYGKSFHIPDIEAFLMKHFKPKQ